MVVGCYRRLSLPLLTSKTIKMKRFEIMKIETLSEEHEIRKLHNKIRLLEERIEELEKERAISK